MTARDRWGSPIECPKCHQKGTLRLSEEGHAFVDDPNIQVEGVDGDFQAEGRPKGVVSVVCGKCKSAFNV